MAVPLYKRSQSQLDAYDKLVCLKIRIIKELKERVEKLEFDNFTKWILTKEMSNLFDILNDIGNNLLIANSIYPTGSSDLSQRYKHQLEAKGACDCASNALYCIAEISPKLLEGLLHFAEELNALKNSISKWIKYNKELKKKFKV